MKKQNALHTAITNIPHIEKRDKGGEDAYLVTDDFAVIAVADGVGGWNKKGVDPALFSNELVKHFKEQYHNLRHIGSHLKLESLDAKPTPTKDISLKELLVESVKRTKSIGTSTFVSAMIDHEESVLYGLNLGDSGYLLLRPVTLKPDQDGLLPYDLLFKTQEQQYKFNHPYQCGTNYKLPYHA